MNFLFPRGFIATKLHYSNTRLTIRVLFRTISKLQQFVMQQIALRTAVKVADKLPRNAIKHFVPRYINVINGNANNRSPFRSDNRTPPQRTTKLPPIHYPDSQIVEGNLAAVLFDHCWSHGNVSSTHNY